MNGRRASIRLCLRIVVVGLLALLPVVAPTQDRKSGKPDAEPLLTGRVLDARGEPVRQQEVHLRCQQTPLNAGPHFRTRVRAEIATVRTDDEGRFRTTLRWPNQHGTNAAAIWEVDVWVPGHGVSRTAAVSFEGVNERTAVFRLEPGGTVVARLTNERGKPIPNVTAELRPTAEGYYDAWRWPLKSDRSGSVRFDGVLPGSYTLHADVPGRMYVILDEAPAAFRVNAGKTTKQHLLLLNEGERIVHGGVFDAKGRLLRNRRIYVTHATGGRQLTTDAEGRFELKLGDLLVPRMPHNEDMSVPRHHTLWFASWDWDLAVPLQKPEAARIDLDLAAQMPVGIDANLKATGTLLLDVREDPPPRAEAAAMAGEGPGGKPLPYLNIDFYEPGTLTLAKSGEWPWLAGGIRLKMPCREHGEDRGKTGRTVVSGLPAGEYELHVWNGHYRGTKAAVKGKTRIRIAAGQTVKVDPIRLKQLPHLVGKLVGLDPWLVGKKSLRLDYMPAGGGDARNCLADFAKQADGSFRLRFPEAGRFRVLVRATAWVSEGGFVLAGGTVSKVVTVEAVDGRDTAVDLNFRPAPLLRVTVTYADGTPAPGHVVKIASTDRELPFPELKLRKTGVEPCDSGPIPPGTYRITVHSPGNPAALATTQVILKKTDKVKDVKVQLTAPAKPVKSKWAIEVDRQIAMLEVGSVRERIEAARELRRLGTQESKETGKPMEETEAYRAVPAVIRAAQTTASYGPMNIFGSLGNMVAGTSGPHTDDLVMWLTEVVENDTRKLRYPAVELLARIGPAAAPAVPALAELLKQPASHHQYVVLLKAIENVGPATEARPQADDDRVTDLLKDLKDARPHVRWSAATTLGKLGDERAVVPLIKALSDKSIQVRWFSARSLGELKDRRAVQPLIGRLQDEHHHVRRAAADALGQLGDKRAIQPLIVACGHDDPDVRRHAMWALKKLADENTGAILLANLKSRKVVLRRSAAYALSRVAGRDAVEPLIVAMKTDTDDRVRARATRALGWTRDRRTFETMLGALKDPAPDVRKFAAEALGNLGDARAIPPLYELLRDPDPWVRWWAMTGLHCFRAKLKPEPFLPVLSDPDKHVRLKACDLARFLDDRRIIEALVKRLTDSDDKVRFKAVVALGKLANGANREVLVLHLSEKDPTVRKGLVEALGRSGSPKAAEILTGLIKDPNAGVRAAAAKALGKIGKDASAAHLLQQLKDPDAAVRRDAARALGKTGDKTAVEPLLEMLNDPDARVRAAAASSLGRLKDTRAVAPLITMLPDDATASSAAFALGVLRDKRAVPALIDCLKRPARNLRHSTAWALGNIGDARAVAPLIEMLSDKDDILQCEAASALRNIGDTRAIPPLVEMLSSRHTDHRSIALDAMRKFGDARAVEPVMKRLTDRAETGSNRQRAIRALERLADKRAVPALIQMALERDGKRYLREEAIGVLGQFGDRRAATPLVGLLPDKHLESSAGRALDRIDAQWWKAPAARALVPSVLKQLTDKDRETGLRAVRVLGRLRDDRAVEPLIACMEKHKDYGRFLVLEALNRITGENFGANPSAWRRWWQQKKPPG